MKPKTISVRDQDLAMWERFAEIAAATDESRASVSKMIASAMADYLDLFGEQGYGLYVQAQGEALDWEYLHRRGITAVLSHSHGSWGLMVRTAYYGGRNEVIGVPGWAYDSGPPMLKLVTAAEVRSAIGTARRYLKMLSRRHWKTKRAEWGRLSDEDKQKVQEMVAAGNHEAVRRMVERFANEG